MREANTRIAAASVCANDMGYTHMYTHVFVAHKVKPPAPFSPPSPLSLSSPPLFPPLTRLRRLDATENGLQTLAVPWQWASRGIKDLLFTGNQITKVCGWV